MPKFTKKPVTIDAVQWFKDGDHPQVKIWDSGSQVYVRGMPYVKTLEGLMLVTPGDWIITGVKGEHYPCKPDIFAMSYDPALEDSRPVQEDQNADDSVDYDKP